MGLDIDGGVEAGRADLHHVRAAPRVAGAGRPPVDSGSGTDDLHPVQGTAVDHDAEQDSIWPVGV